jgi:fructose-1,6-bisphosphatase/sedoheptulose 1,7-bisphosphatase-like protein
MVDIAVDPLDGTTLTAQGRSGAIAVSIEAHAWVHGLLFRQER